MKKISLMLVALLAFGLASMDQAWAKSPKVIAAKFHADWCNSCKMIDPAYKSAINASQKTMG